MSSTNDRIEKQSGSSMISLMLVVGLLTAGGAVLGSMFLDRLKDEQQVTLQQGAEMAKRNIIGALAHDVGWRATIMGQSELYCLQEDGRVCTPPAGQKISVLLADGTTKLIAAGVANQGFDRLGNVCNNFDAVAGNDECPFQFELAWSCEGGSCVPTKTPALGIVPAEPRIVIQGTMKFKPKSKGIGFQMRSEFYNFSIVRGAEERDLSATCRSIGGYFDQGRKHCSIQSTNAGCDEVTQYMAGIDSSGRPICKNKEIMNVFCPPKHAAVGLSSAGRLVCGKF